MLVTGRPFLFLLRMDLEPEPRADSVMMPEDMQEDMLQSIGLHSCVSQTFVKNDAYSRR